MLCRQWLAITAVSHSRGIQCLYSIRKQPIHSEEKGEMLAHPLLACHKCNLKTWPRKIDRVTCLPCVRHPGPMANCCFRHTNSYSLTQLFKLCPSIVHVEPTSSMAILRESTFGERLCDECSTLMNGITTLLTKASKRPLPLLVLLNMAFALSAVDGCCKNCCLRSRELYFSK